MFQILKRKVARANNRSKAFKSFLENTTLAPVLIPLEKSGRAGTIVTDFFAAVALVTE